MGLYDILAASGAVAWAFLLWRTAQSLRRLPKRLRWALWGYKASSHRRVRS